MPNATNVPATVPPRTPQHNLFVTPTARTTLLQTPRRFAVFLHPLQTLRAAWTRPRCREHRCITPDYPRQETVPERVARTEPYLYIRSLSG
jgi:hypothetical protein